jgi:ABC-type lipoprotein export system ATPase subunit/ABC-type antimicrobial peptide transport system permease subunit
MIRIEKIDKYFNRFKKNQIHVINNTSLEFDCTGLVALLGPSGSGKTTLLNVIGGLDKVRKGRIYINNKKITHRLQGSIDKTRNLNIGYIFQDYKLIENLSVYENVSIVLKMLGIRDKEEIDKRVCYVLDKVGMLRYKKRPCSMLSGGEKQRVGIARAIVKNPNIIIADEPTGNLDSKNSIEVMNIIKAISKDKLVVLVTHEVNLAKFYASRIIELEDGKIINDYPNNNENDLDYQFENILYLKDYKYRESLDNINIYSNEETKLHLNIVVNKNNIYISTLDNKKIEVIGDDSTIEMVDDHYKNITRNDIDKYEFNYNEIINNKKKLKYKSIFNPITFITNGFNKVFHYPLLKKILLFGFLLSGIFITYATSSIFGSLTINDKDFVTLNKNYLLIDSKKLVINNYLNLESDLRDKILYMLPTDSTFSAALKVDDYYQTTKYSINLGGSLTSIDTITSNDLILGEMPSNSNEIVIDKIIADKLFDEELAIMMGISRNEDLIGREVKIDKLNDFKIVGIVNTKSPSIYASNNMFINILYHTSRYDSSKYSYTDDTNSDLVYDDYNLYTSSVTLKEGRWPENDYEVIVNYSNKEDMKLNKEIKKTINDRKLVVVGYYTSKDGLDTYLVNSNMIKLQLISKSSDIVIYSTNKEETLNYIRENYNINVTDSYKNSKQTYINERKDSIKSSIISSSIILLISLVEIFLMIRSSFLSRIKEVGIYRAIGVKKKDIYIMFSGEIIAITTLTSVPGILLCAYVLKNLSEISYLSGIFIINSGIVLLCVIFIYLFNLIVGLIPVFNTIRKRPAEILARTDI